VDVTVVVATYGEDSWCQLAESRALPSVGGTKAILVHHDNLHAARNRGLDLVETEWVSFLDADDELEAGYFDAMAKGTADVRAPAVRYVEGARRHRPRVPTVAGHSHVCAADCLSFGNWLVIGSTVRTELLRRIGGFRDFPWSEDWDLWVRCRAAGATFEAVPDAIYRAHVRRDSRNRGPAREAKLDAHRAIARANGLPVPA
jgi:glycosyltransferase involved in cell wall biosynthesis